MLTPEQISSVRTAAGAPPLQGGSPGVSLSSRLGLDGSQPQGYLHDVQTSEAAGADMAGKGFTDAAGNIGQDWNNYTKNIQGANPVEQVLHGLVFLGHTAGNVAGATGKAIAGTTKAAAAPVTSLRSPATGKTLGESMTEHVAQPIENYMAQGVQNVKAAHPGLVDFLTKNPEVGKGLLDLLSTASLAGGGKTEVPALSDAMSAVKNTARDTGETIARNDARMGGNFPTASTESKTGVVDTLRARMGENNAAAGLRTSAGRLADQAPLQGAGAAREAKPLDIYNSAANGAVEHLSDPTMIDKPSELFGKEEISKSFEDVVKKRRDAGEAMRAELENPKVGNIKTNVTATKQGIIDEMTKQKLNYDPKQGKLLSLGGQSPMGSADRSMVEDYIKDLGTLDNKPTVSDVNNFIQRTTADLDLYKQKNQITGSTNGERIIKANLAKLRETISADATKNPSLKPYSDAKAEYSRLSPIIDTGVPLLGKKSLDGGFIRDAAVAKRAIQSMSDGGSKDFLRALEKETGNPLLDKAFVILQAEKDAGITSAHSLLDLFSKDNALKIPGSGSLGSRLFDWTATRVAGKATGSSADQTRAFLKSLEESTKKATGPSTPPKAEVPPTPSTPKSSPSTNGSIVDKAKGIFKNIKDNGNRGFVKIPMPKMGPEDIAAHMDDKDFAILTSYIKDPTDINTFTKVQDMFDSMGIGKMAEEDQTRFVQDTLKHYEKETTQTIKAKDLDKPGLKLAK